jgi:hypothetical protein
MFIPPIRDISFSVLRDEHAGQAGLDVALLATISSKVLLQSLQWYSYMGIGILLIIL